MPLIYKKDIDAQTKLAVWEATEPDDFFKEHLQLNSEEIHQLSLMKPHRLREWLSSRYLCHLMSGGSCRIELIKDDYGKPSLKELDSYISLSHSKNRTAFIFSDKRVGIDIQYEENKIARIQHKFISLKEKAAIDNNQELAAFHIFWGAKECMYKAYGKKELDFKKHMHLYPFKIFQEQLELKGWVRKNEVSQYYDIHVDMLDNYFLTFAIHSNEEN